MRSMCGADASCSAINYQSLSNPYPTRCFLQKTNCCHVISPRAAPEENKEIGILLPNNQCQHRTLHIQKDVLPYALC